MGCHFNYASNLPVSMEATLTNGCNVLLLGGGGREHALAFRLSQSKTVNKVFASPGNAGIEQIANVQNVALNKDGYEEIVEFVMNTKNDIQLVCIGPEKALVDGLVDILHEKLGKNICFGPTKAAARLEGSKAFSKDFMSRHKVPTAGYECFNESSPEKILKHLAGLPSVESTVIKYSGLAAGKGVLLPKTLKDAEEFVKDIYGGRFGNEGQKNKHEIVVEERLSGLEVSVFCICEGSDYIVLPFVQDYKQVEDGDKGLNTGGIGAHVVTRENISPTHQSLSLFREDIQKDIIASTLQGCVKDGMPYSGVLYIGLMLTTDGPKVLEYNCRFGDPEAQILVALLDSSSSEPDLFEIMCHVAYEKLSLKSISSRINFREDMIAAALVLCSKGYPIQYETGKIITGVEEVSQEDNVFVFHAGTKLLNGNLVTSSGRVLSVVVVGTDAASVQSKLYSMSERIKFSTKYNRSDIGYKMFG